ncbi:hypothetical protein CVT25_007295 [Psilocybe cyanescens]|uniref:Aminoglycoside phosphotransferase domain-containing protein n=1 Tax=Psilocybe cyanescens TaxID=93625 RepID=A0A409XPF5_PSICY|nr:hypothetical protein CVT25_007295 [Psilocybe cyanescens]
MIVQDMKSQYSAMHQQTSTRDHIICSASGGSIEDPRLPWLEDVPDATFSSSCQFMEQVWVGLNNNRTPRSLYQMLIPLIQRDTSIVFTHGDALPKNIIMPGGLELYRRGHSRLCIIDWEYAGWMPEPWEALKATRLICDRNEEEWYRMMREVFPDQCEVLDAEWEWRIQTTKAVAGCLYLAGFAQSGAGPHAAIVLAINDKEGHMFHIRIDKGTSAWKSDFRAQKIDSSISLISLVKIRDISKGAITAAGISEILKTVNVPSGGETGECTKWVRNAITLLNQKGTVTCTSLDNLIDEFHAFCAGNRAYATTSKYPNVMTSSYCA